MTVYLIPNMKKRDVRAAVETVARCLRGLGAQVLLPLALEETFEGQDAQFLCDADAFARCDVAVTVGGDGTILHAAKRGLSYHRPLLGVNLGRMGFLATAECGDSAKFERLVRGDWREDRRAVLSVRCRGKRPFESVALNDLVIAKTGIGQTVDVSIWCDGILVNEYLGDGVVVSTPTGSTAYSLSAGGPVVAPTCACLVISPLAPHNLTMRPVVIPDTAVITLHVHTRRSDAFVTLDNRVYAVGQEATFTVKRAEQKIFLAVPHNISFYDTLRNKMMWGIDIRS